MTDNPLDAMGAFSLWGERSEIIHLEQAGERHSLAISTADGRDWSCRTLSAASGAAWTATLLHGDFQANRLQILHDGKEIAASLALWPGHLAVFLGDETHEFALPDLLEADAGEEVGADAIIAPMPGLVKKLSAKSGQKIAKDDPLIVLEAMKMEHVLAAPRDGVLAAVNVAEGDQVVDGTVLIALEPEDGEAAV